MNYSDHASAKRTFIVAIALGLLAGIISSFHHWYGAIVYETPWRSGVSYWIGGSVLGVYSLLFVYWKFSDNLIGRFSLWVFFLAAVVFQTGFTMFECVYSHVLKNILFFVGAPHSILERMYPSPTYHLPDNLVFELTGLLQLVGLVAAWLAYRIFQDRPWAN